MNKIIIVHFEEDPMAIESFKKTVSKLWHQHVEYTRNAIISTLEGLEDGAAVAARLMTNQEDIGNLIIAPYYGTQAGADLTNLLKEHISIAGRIIQAVKDGTSTTELETLWQSNADAIATLLDSLDPDNWPKDAVLGMLKDHLACTLEDIKQRKVKDWAKEFAAHDACQTIIETLAYAIADGIVDKFPEAFVIQYSSKTIKKK